MASTSWASIASKIKSATGKTWKQAVKEYQRYAKTVPEGKRPSYTGYQRWKSERKPVAKPASWQTIAKEIQRRTGVSWDRARELYREYRDSLPEGKRPTLSGLREWKLEDKAKAKEKVDSQKLVRLWRLKHVFRDDAALALQILLPFAASALQPVREGWELSAVEYARRINPNINIDTRFRPLYQIVYTIDDLAYGLQDPNVSRDAGLLMFLIAYSVQVNGSVEDWLKRAWRRWLLRHDLPEWMYYSFMAYMY